VNAAVEINVLDYSVVVRQRRTQCERGFTVYSPATLYSLFRLTHIASDKISVGCKSYEFQILILVNVTNLVE